MPARLAAWAKAQFAQPHTWRDVDLAYWWQMPHDETRTVSPWLQLPVDLVTRATFSEWHEKVAESRIGYYDRLRPYTTRAALLAVIALALGALQAPGWCWMLLAPALAQVVLEVYLYRYIHESPPEPRWDLVRWMRDMVNDHQRTMMLNITGLIGVLACPLNLLAAGFAPPGGTLGWVKLVAFTAAVFYTNSALASAFLDPSNYTETSRMPPVMHWLRPFAPVLSAAAAAVVVTVGVAYERWTPAMIAPAYLSSALALLSGSTIRNHDRIIGAAARVAREAVVAARRELGGVIHDDLNAAKTAAETVRQIPGVPYRDFVELATLEAYLTHLSTRMGLYAAPKMQIGDVVEKIASPYGFAPADITCDIRWAHDTGRENHAIAIRMTTALVHNAVQALQRSEYLDLPRSLAVEGFTTGDGHDLRYHLAVHDYLPVIDGHSWCSPGSTLRALRDWLEDSFAGDLTQEDVGDGRKRIVATWLDRPPVRGYQTETIDRTGP